ncbi:hypothetical protein OCU04_005895 [Sclerotinia nivalis]|uniref:Uncharacterized protein n=1 Tax=Sclerotinia nivalis TaxID=352851 RepID=A0A9X0AMQ2_9HELO|nr:hypothetical protein OCU04_005895 [Sclerotinia nivalis]
MAQQLTSMTVLSRGEDPWPMADYTRYGISWSLFRGFRGILLRKRFVKWLYALFFRLAIPFTLNIAAQAKLISSPLTLTIIFRLIAHLRIIGYPSHWMSEALSNILENKVHTTARPPRHSPNPVTEVKREHPRRHLCTSPFVQEMATLARIFETLLPFSLPSLAVIPKANNIFNYNFTFVMSAANEIIPSALVTLYLSFTIMTSCKNVKKT